MSKDTRYLNLTELEHFSEELSDKLKGRVEYKGGLDIIPTGQTTRTDWNDIILLNNPSLIGDVYKLMGTTGQSITIDDVVYMVGEYIIVTNEVDADAAGVLTDDITVMKFGGGAADIDKKTILDTDDHGEYAQLHTRIGGYLSDESDTTICEKFTSGGGGATSIWYFVARGLSNALDYENVRFFHLDVFTDSACTVPLLSGDYPVLSYSIDSGICTFKTKNVNPNEWTWNSDMKITYNINNPWILSFETFFTSPLMPSGGGTYSTIYARVGAIHPIKSEFVNIDKIALVNDTSDTTQETGVLRAKSGIEITEFPTDPKTEVIYRLTSPYTDPTTKKEYKAGIYVYDKTDSANPKWLDVSGTAPDELTIRSRDIDDSLLGGRGYLRTAVNGYRHINDTIEIYTTTFTFASAQIVDNTMVLTSNKFNLDPMEAYKVADTLAIGNIKLTDGTNNAQINMLEYHYSEEVSYDPDTGAIERTYYPEKDWTCAFHSAIVYHGVVDHPEESYIEFLDVDSEIVGKSWGTITATAEYLNCYNNTIRHITGEFLPIDSNTVTLHHFTDNYDTNFLQAHAIVDVEMLPDYTDDDVEVIERTIYRSATATTIGTDTYPAGLYTFDTDAYYYVPFCKVEPDAKTIVNKNYDGEDIPLKTAAGGSITDKEGTELICTLDTPSTTEITIETTNKYAFASWYITEPTGFSADYLLTKGARIHCGAINCTLDGAAVTLPGANYRVIFYDQENGMTFYKNEDDDNLDIIVASNLSGTCTFILLWTQFVDYTTWTDATLSSVSFVLPDINYLDADMIRIDNGSIINEHDYTSSLVYGTSLSAALKTAVGGQRRQYTDVCHEYIASFEHDFPHQISGSPYKYEVYYTWGDLSSLNGKVLYLDADENGEKTYQTGTYDATNDVVTFKTMTVKLNVDNNTADEKLKKARFTRNNEWYGSGHYSAILSYQAGVELKVDSPLNSQFLPVDNVSTAISYDKLIANAIVDTGKPFDTRYSKSIYHLTTDTIISGVTYPAGFYVYTGTKWKQIDASTPIDKETIKLDDNSNIRTAIGGRIIDSNFETSFVSDYQLEYIEDEYAWRYTSGVQALKLTDYSALNNYTSALRLHVVDKTTGHTTYTFDRDLFLITILPDVSTGYNMYYFCSKNDGNDYCVASFTVNPSATTQIESIYVNIPVDDGATYKDDDVYVTFNFRENTMERMDHPELIPVDGKTITVVNDGVNDVNQTGLVAHAIIDTTMLSDTVDSIQHYNNSGYYIYDKDNSKYIKLGETSVDEKTIRSTNDSGTTVPLYTQVGGWKKTATTWYSVSGQSDAYEMPSGSHTFILNTANCTYDLVNMQYNGYLQANNTVNFSLINNEGMANISFEGYIVQAQTTSNEWTIKDPNSTNEFTFIDDLSGTYYMGANITDSRIYSGTGYYISSMKVLKYSDNELHESDSSFVNIDNTTLIRAGADSNSNKKIRTAMGGWIDEASTASVPYTTADFYNYASAVNSLNWVDNNLDYLTKVGDDGHLKIWIDGNDPVEYDGSFDSSITGDVINFTTSDYILTFSKNAAMFFNCSIKKADSSQIDAFEYFAITLHSSSSAVSQVKNYHKFDPYYVPSDNRTIRVLNNLLRSCPILVETPTSYDPWSLYDARSSFVWGGVTYPAGLYAWVNNNLKQLDAAGVSIDNKTIVTNSDGNIETAVGGYKETGTAYVSYPMQTSGNATLYGWVAQDDYQPEYYAWCSNSNDWNQALLQSLYDNDTAQTAHFTISQYSTSKVYTIAATFAGTKRPTEDDRYVFNLNIGAGTDIYQGRLVIWVYDPATKDAQVWFEMDEDNVSASGLNLDADMELIAYASYVDVLESTDVYHPLETKFINVDGSSIINNTSTSPGKLSVQVLSTGGLSTSSSGLGIKLVSNCGLVTSSNGLGIKLTNTGGLTASSSGLGILLPSSSALTLNSAGLSVAVDDSTIKINSSNKLYANYSSGTSLPSTGTTGQIFFLYTT